MVVANFTRVTNSLVNEGTFRNAVEFAVSEANGGGGGMDGVQGPAGPVGPVGPEGPTGPTGEFGIPETIKIGYEAGVENQGTQGIAIGAKAGRVDQSGGSIAIGSKAGEVDQGDAAVAIGEFAGISVQGPQGVAIGADAGQASQGQGAVAVGYRAGLSNQGANAIAIGANAAPTLQPAGSIALNASTSDLAPNAAGLFVNPLRQDNSKMFVSPRPMFYNQSTSEVYCAPFSAQDFEPDTFPFGCTITNKVLFGQQFGAMKYTFGRITQVTTSGGAPSPVITCTVQVYTSPDFFLEIGSVNATVTGDGAAGINDVRVSLLEPATLITVSGATRYKITYQVVIGANKTPVDPAGYTTTVYLNIVGF